MACKLLRWPLMFLLVTGCSRTPDGDACERTFQPFPDLISQRTRTAANGPYLDAMANYSAGRYAEAIDGLQAFLHMQREDQTAYIYLASAYLAIGKPYDAELQLDHLQRGVNLHYDDQIEWYRVVCWLCSGQEDRARKGAEAIVSGGAHTYGKEARELLERLPVIAP